MENKKVALAIVSLVLGIIGLIFSFIPILNNMSFIMGGYWYRIWHCCTFNAS